MWPQATRLGYSIITPVFDSPVGYSHDDDGCDDDIDDDIDDDNDDLVTPSSHLSSNHLLVILMMMMTVMMGDMSHLVM